MAAYCSGSGRDDGRETDYGRVMKPHAIVVGAGIGGLAAAIGLKRAGCTVEVYERARELKAVGAGITIQPNAVLALRHLGVGEEIVRAGQVLKPTAGLARADGTVLSQLDAAEGERLIAEVGAPIVGIHRATLHDVMVAALGREHLRLGHTAEGYELTDSSVKVRFHGGEVREAELVVGADGIRSACRRQLLGDGEPTYAGYFCWRGISPTRGELPQGWGGEVWGAGRRFGGCTVDGGRLYWFAVAQGPPGGEDPKGSARAAVLKHFEDFVPMFRDVIAATPEEAIIRSDIADRPTVTKWGEGRLTLLGDAAHPMTPNLGQGACQAIEDALVLATGIARGSDVAAALRAYEAERQRRANAVVEAARRFGAIGQWSNGAARWARDTLVRLTPASVLRKQLVANWKLPYGGF